MAKHKSPKLDQDDYQYLDNQDTEASDEYEILPHSKVSALKSEIDKLKSAGGQPYQGKGMPQTEKLIESIEKLNTNIETLIKIFNETTTELIDEYHTGFHEESEKVNRLVEQNEDIAKGIVAVADMIGSMKGSEANTLLNPDGTPIAAPPGMSAPAVDGQSQAPPSDLTQPVAPPGDAFPMAGPNDPNVSVPTDLSSNVGPDLGQVASSEASLGVPGGSPLEGSPGPGSNQPGPDPIGVNPAVGQPSQDPFTQPNANPDPFANPAGNPIDNSMGRMDGNLPPIGQDAAQQGQPDAPAAGDFPPPPDFSSSPADPGAQPQDQTMNPPSGGMNPGMDLGAGGPPPGVAPNEPAPMGAMPNDPIADPFSQPIGQPAANDPFAQPNSPEANPATGMPNAPPSGLPPGQPMDAQQPAPGGVVAPPPPPPNDAGEKKKGFLSFLQK